MRKNVLVTGGASFIGSHLVEKLVSLGATIKVVDNLSSGRVSNLSDVMDQIEFVKGDLRNRCFTKNLMSSPSPDIVFHLAASHGGRGYIDTHPADCCNNMALDQTVFEMAQDAGVSRICFASSACVYPTNLQETSGGLLKEEDADPFVRGKAFADQEYGWAKLMGEMSLKAYHKEYGMKTSSVRIFTAYGERENETHAVIALIAKAFIEMDPYEIWGTGEQDRNFTYVKDIVDAMVLASEKITDGTPVNAGTSKHIKIKDVAKLVFEIVGWKPRKIIFDETKPVGVFSRAADLTRSRRLLWWEPKTSFKEGLKRTIDWYFATKDPQEVTEKLETLLFHR